MQEERKKVKKHKKEKVKDKEKERKESKSDAATNEVRKIQFEEFWRLCLVC